MAQLHLGSLAKKNNKKDVRLALQRLPEKLDDTYADAIKRISSQDKEDVQLAKRTLMWISCAKRPLSIIELQHALAIEPGAKEIDPESLPDKDVIIDVCSGLVAIDRESDTIRLVHYTTQDYLVRVRAELFATAEIDMTFCCLTYLLFTTSAQISEPGKYEWDHVKTSVAELEAANPFWSYAARYWGSHAHEKAQYDARMQHLVFQLLELNNQALGLARSEPIRAKWAYFDRLRDVPGMYTAAYFDLSELVGTLLDRGTLVDANIDEHYVTTALHCAAISGHVATLRLLLDRGALIDMPDRIGYTALRMAAEEGHKDSVQVLLEKGADVDRQHPDGTTALNLAARKGFQGIVKLLLEKGADVNRQDCDGKTALSVAAQSGYEDVDSQYFDGTTALYMAAESGYQGIVGLLLENGADVNGRDYCGKTALYIAAMSGHQGIVELLLENGADVNGEDCYGKTALYEAARCGHQGIMGLLLEKGADPNGHEDSRQPVLSIAAQSGYQGTVELLLEKGADVNGQYYDGTTALYVAAESGYQGIVELLLEKGADVNGQDYCGKTALYIAAKSGHRSVVELLLEKGADVNCPDAAGEPVLPDLAWRGDDSMLEILLRYGADVDIRSRYDGATALHVAASRGNKTAVQLLIDAGADHEAEWSCRDL